MAMVFLDGAMGTQLQALGLRPGEIPELWNLERPSDVQAVHEAYFAAGADVVYANTFGANRAKYHGAAPLADVIQSGVGIARAAAAKAGPARRVALDIGPTGRLLKPSGDFEFDAAYDAFAELVATGAPGADLVAIETMGDLHELKAAVLAAKENCSLPILATVALGEDGKLLTGAGVECVAVVLEGLGVDAVGLNCGLGPDKLLPFVRRMAAATRLPIAVKANAGMPALVDGRTVFSVTPEDFARDFAALAEAGASILGGCCGTTPDPIAALRRACGGMAAPLRTRRCGTFITSGSRILEIPFDDTLTIGERINPTGKKKLREALERGDTAYVLREAVAQHEAGAHVLDVNVGVPGLDESALLDATVQAIQGVTDLPLQIDTSDPAALERAMRHYNGKPLVNSVNGKEESMAAVLPLVAKYGGCVVALTLDENGIPSTAEGRVAIARKIIGRGAQYGLTKDDFVIDVLSLAVSADSRSAETILKALRMVREDLGCRTCLGVSNISFGLPGRPLLNAAFYTLAMGHGLSAGIINPLSQEMMCAHRAYRALAGKDPSCSQWIEFAPQVGSIAPSRDRKIESAAQAVAGDATLAAIRRGLAGDAAEAAKAALAGGAQPLDIVNGSIVPALEEVGKGFETGKIFLPQLLMAAEAAGAAFDAVRSAMPQGGGKERGPIVIATVKGDIHDIGKNICRALLENYGFKVIDLGRDVAPEAIVDAARREHAALVGLSALMTTTVGAMEQTVRLVHRELPGTRVVVGGAVLTQDYADKIGADFYTKDAMALVRLAERIFPANA